MAIANRKHVISAVYIAGVRDPTDAANAKAVRCEDPILLCTMGPDAVIAGILEATCEIILLATMTHAAALTASPAGLPAAVKHASYGIAHALIALTQSSKPAVSKTLPNRQSIQSLPKVAKAEVRGLCVCSRPNTGCNSMGRRIQQKALGDTSGQSGPRLQHRLQPLLGCTCPAGQSL